MRRDDDLIRDILLRFEDEEEWLKIAMLTSSTTKQEEREYYHIQLLKDVGFMTDVGSGTVRLTNQGHDYIQAIRSETAWEKTKSGAAEIGGATLSMMRDLAVAYLKQEAAEKLGIKL